MDRNLFSRVEACFPVEDPVLRKRIIEQGLENYLKDNQQAWELQPDGQWLSISPKEGEEVYISQQVLLEHFQ